jgi:hypothetical protein
MDGLHGSEIGDSTVMARQEHEVHRTVGTEHTTLGMTSSADQASLGGSLIWSGRPQVKPWRFNAVLHSFIHHRQRSFNSDRWSKGFG